MPDVADREHVGTIVMFDTEKDRSLPPITRAIVFLHLVWLSKTAIPK